MAELPVKVEYVRTPWDSLGGVKLTHEPTNTVVVVTKYPASIDNKVEAWEALARILDAQRRIEANDA